jgi:hypothetical protein
MNKTVIVLFSLLAGCASTKDIDLSKVESGCGQACSANYSNCLSGFSMFPIQRQRECTSALRLCASACPARNAQH